MPVTLDVGTDNDELRHDPLYIGLLRSRLRGEPYDALIDEFVTAVQERFPRALVQFEDFGNRNAFRLLRKYRDRVCTFNDDIQGTAAVALAGIFSVLRITGGALADQRFLFLGAGEAGTGIADLIVSALEEAGMDSREARLRSHFLDSKGLVVKARSGLAEHKIPYAHDHEPIESLEDAVESLRPTVLIGVSGQPQTFTEPVLRKMAEINERPIIFALSNPTSKAECTAEDAYRATNGRAIFASGSPFAPVDFEGRTFVPGQGNNAYVFPGIGLGIVASGAQRIPDSVFLAAAKALAAEVQESSLEQGCIYPPLNRMRATSLAVARAVCRVVFDEGLTDEPEPADLDAHLERHVYEPVYQDYV
jgi:malate dehydrogenase (oxaloacetate-decarboxylating)(NADP+)